MNALAYYQKKGINFDTSENASLTLSKLNAVSSILSAVPGLGGTISAFQNVINIKDSVLSLRKNASDKIDSVVNLIDKTQTELNLGQKLLNVNQVASNTAKLVTAGALQADSLLGNEAPGPRYVYGGATTAAALGEEGTIDTITAGQSALVETITTNLENAKSNLIKAKDYLSIVDDYIVKIENNLTDFGNVILFKLRNCIVSLDTKGPGSIEAFIPNAANIAANEEIEKISKNISSLQNNSLKSVNSIIKIAANPFK